MNVVDAVLKVASWWFQRKLRKAEAPNEVRPIPVPPVYYAGIADFNASEPNDAAYERTRLKRSDVDAMLHGGGRINVLCNVRFCAKYVLLFYPDGDIITIALDRLTPVEPGDVLKVKL